MAETRPGPLEGLRVLDLADEKGELCGRLLADRAMSRLLKKDWPRSLEELEARRQRGRGGLT